jgi:hypothetical protein
MTTYTIATLNRTILTCAPDGQSIQLAERIGAMLRPLSIEMQARIESQLVEVEGVTLFADEVAAFRAGALDLWRARPGALDGMTDAEGNRASVAAQLGGRKPWNGR